MANLNMQGSTAGADAPITDTTAPATSTTQAKSWRDVLPIHPAADKIPLASDSERRGLAGDLASHGQKVPVVLVRVAGGPPQLLDGRHRLDFLEGTGITIVDDAYGIMVQHQVVDVADDAEAERLSLSCRRHLPADERRKLLQAQLKATPEKSDVAIGEIVGFSDKTVTKVRRDLEATSEIPRLEKTVGKDGKARKQPKKRDPEKERAAREERKRERRGDLLSFEETMAAADAELDAELDAETSAEARKAAYAADEDDPAATEVVADDEKLALLSKFARFVIERATAIKFEPKDHAEYKVLRGRVKQALDGGK